MHVTLGLKLDSRLGPCNQDTLDQPVVGPLGLLGLLETWLGLSRPEVSTAQRVTSYLGNLRKQAVPSRFYSHSLQADSGPVYVVRAESLERLFDMYWWNRKDFEGNMLALSAVSQKIKEAIEGENSPRAHKLAEAACHEVMKWGFGEKRRAYAANMSWAKQQEQALPHVLRMGREALSGDNPDIEAFGGSESSHTHSPRMNAGWTKYYALALPNHIIYDGRVGAALGFLVQRYLASLSHFAGVPEKLQFLWANGDGGRTLRDPSTGGHQFSKLYGGCYGSKSWARVNVWANWILSDARDKAGAEWCAGPDGLRRLEAALFMLGYDFHRVRDSHSSRGADQLRRAKRSTSEAA